MAIRDTEIYIIEPAAATNLIINPSFESSTVPYVPFGTAVAIDRTATYQRRGAYGLDITTASATASGVLYEPVTLTSGTTYTFSCDVKDVASQTFYIAFCSTAGVSAGTPTTWTGDGYWKRKSVTYSATASAAFGVILVRDSVAATDHFYTDGWQVEAGSGSTYFDGDSVGFSRYRTDYGWNGTAHMSTSWRSAKTRSGGTLLRLRDYAGLEGVIGLGMPPMANNAIPSSAGGAFVQNTVPQIREFTLLLHFKDKNGLSGLYAKRAQLIDAIKPDNVPSDEPIVLRWELEDTSGNVKSETLDLICKYSGGLEYNASEPGTAQILERASVTFTAFDPMFIADGTQGADLTVGTSVANAAYLLYRTADGVWTSTGALSAWVHDLKQSSNGYIYATGFFTNLGGAAGDYIAYWNGTAWSALATAGLEDTGYCLAIAPDGYPYVGGAFTDADGVADCNYLAKYNGTTFVELDNGASGPVHDCKMDDSGNLYIIGDFINVGAAATVVNHVAKWTGTAWAAMASGLPAHAGDLFWASLAVKKNTVYAAISYSINKADNRVSKWNGTAWTDLACPVEAPCAIEFGPDGNLYVGGIDDANAHMMMAVYSGGSWKTIIPDGVDSGVIRKFYRSKKSLYLMGTFTTLNGVSIPGGIAEYANGVFKPIDLPVTAGGDIYTILETANGELWVGGAMTTTPVTAPGVITTTNGSSKAYPVIRFTGPGKLWQLKNYTTGKAIWFNNLTLQAGETAILDLRPGRVRFTSDWRGNILKYLPGSDFDFFLQSGANNISLYMTGTTAATKALMSYQNRYWSIDAAAR